MKKSTIKELIISSIAAAVAGYIVKKGYDYFQTAELPEIEKKKNSNQEESLPDRSKRAVTEVAEAIDDSPVQQGIIATLAYSLAVSGISKFLRKII